MLNDESVRFDYAAVTSLAHEGVLDSIIGACNPHEVRRSPGIHGWDFCQNMIDSRGDSIARVFTGGRGDIHAVVSSDRADLIYPDWRDDIESLRVSRVDACVDTLADFEDLENILVEAASVYGSKIVYMRSESRGESLGRTVYLGAASARVRVRLYEKWLESPGQYINGTNRVEVQVRPDSSAKRIVSQWSANEAFCASRTTQKLAQLMSQSVTVPREGLRIAPGIPSTYESLVHVRRQYHRHLEDFLRFNDGDLAKLGSFLAGSGDPAGTEN